jgi:hypothetical protein
LTAKVFRGEILGSDHRYVPVAAPTPAIKKFYIDGKS